MAAVSVRTRSANDSGSRTGGGGVWIVVGRLPSPKVGVGVVGRCVRSAWFRSRSARFPATCRGITNRNPPIETRPDPSRQVQQPRVVLDRDLRGRDPARSGQRGDTHRQTDLGRGRPTPQRPGDSCSHIGGIAGIGERDQVPGLLGPQRVDQLLRRGDPVRKLGAPRRVSNPRGRVVIFAEIC